MNFNCTAKMIWRILGAPIANRGAVCSGSILFACKLKFTAIVIDFLFDLLTSDKHLLILLIANRSVVNRIRNIIFIDQWMF